MNTLALVTGAQGAIGRAYLQHLSSMKHVQCIAVSRSQNGVHMDSVRDVCVSDLANPQLTNKALAHLDLNNVDRVLLIHAVGKFVFEDPDEAHAPVPNPAIVESNVTTCVNTVNALLSQIRCEHSTGHVVQLVLCAFGSISDKCLPELWPSFSAAKNMLRDWLERLPAMNADLPVRTRFINISSTHTEAEDSLRPCVDVDEKQHWLLPHEVVERSWGTIMEACSARATAPWKEIDIYKKNRLFHDGYYKAEHALPRWRRALSKNR